MPKKEAKQRRQTGKVMLHFSPARTSHPDTALHLVITWMTALQTVILSKNFSTFGFSKIFNTDGTAAYPTIPKPVKQTPKANDEEDALFCNKKFDAEMERFVARLEEFESEKTQIFTLVWKSIDELGQSKLEASSKHNHLLIERNDPLGLVSATWELYLSPTNNKFIDRNSAEKAFLNMSQGAQEPLHEFKKRFLALITVNHLLAPKTATGNQPSAKDASSPPNPASTVLSMTEADKATLFVNKLNTIQYQEALREYHNKLHGPFATVEQAYEWAHDYVASSTKNAVGFVSLGKTPATPQQPEQEENASDAQARRAGRTGRSQSQTAHKPHPHYKNYNPTKKNPCRACGGIDHWDKDEICPQHPKNLSKQLQALAKQNKSLIKQNKKLAEEMNKLTGKVALVSVNQQPSAPTAAAASSTQQQDRSVAFAEKVSSGDGSTSSGSTSPSSDEED